MTMTTQCFEVYWRQKGETKWRDSCRLLNEESARRLIDAWSKLGYECQLVQATTVRVVIA